MRRRVTEEFEISVSELVEKLGITGKITHCNFDTRSKVSKGVKRKLKIVVEKEKNEDDSNGK